MSIWTAAFWKGAGERAISTTAQAGISAIAVGPATGVVDVHWLGVASIAGLAGILSVLKSVAAGASDGNPSLGSVEVIATPGAEADPIGGDPVEVEDAPQRMQEEDQ